MFHVEQFYICIYTDFIYVYMHLLCLHLKFACYRNRIFWAYSEQFVRYIIITEQLIKIKAQWSVLSYSTTCNRYNTNTISMTNNKPQKHPSKLFKFIPRHNIYLNNPSMLHKYIVLHSEYGKIQAIGRL